MCEKDAVRSMTGNGRRALLMLSALVLTFVLLRLSLYISPGANLNVGPYNIHHLFTGLLLISAAGIPLAMLRGGGYLLDGAAAVFGAGLAMALDEWVYLIATDGSDASYLLPVSFWGGVVMVMAAVAYAAVILLFLSLRGKNGP